MKSAAELKKIMEDEYVKCSRDPIYFFKQYCVIRHPIKGKLKFNLYPFQEKTLEDFGKFKYNIILKSRQMGISTLCAGHIIHKMIFNTDYAVLVIATKQEVAKNLVTKIQLMYDCMPSWLQVPIVENNKLALKLKNGSSVKAVASSPSAGRSEALSLLVFDECVAAETQITLLDTLTNQPFKTTIGEAYNFLEN